MNHSKVPPKVWTNNDDFYEQEHRKAVRALELKKERILKYGPKGASNLKFDLESFPPPKRYRTRK